MTKPEKQNYAAERPSAFARILRAVPGTAFPALVFCAWFGLFGCSGAEFGAKALDGVESLLDGVEAQAGNSGDTTTVQFRGASNAAGVNPRVDPENSGVGDLDEATDDEEEKPLELPPCLENDDCESGWCVMGPDGTKVCTTACIDSCAPGWRCEQMQMEGADLIFLCVPRWSGLCRPCGSHAECVLEDSMCIAHGEEGSFCATACVYEDDCPSGYGCDDGVCMRNEGICECDAGAVKAEASTDCSRANGHGTCVGTRTCSEEGLADCGAMEPAQESCDGVDNDCDDIVDEGTVGLECTVDNEHGSCVGTSTCAATAPGCEATTPEPEICDGLDNNCDGKVDEPGALGCTQFYLDGDGDGYGFDAISQCRCEPQGNFKATKGGDCNDADQTVNPNALEICDLLDNDCDGTIDNPSASGCSWHYADQDHDGYGKDDESACLCNPNVDHPVTVLGDCDDETPTINPGAEEICGGGDEDCDTEIDEEGASGCTDYFKDGDGDAWGNPLLSSCLCEPGAIYSTTQQGDCNDNEGLTYPGALEHCDFADNDCDTMVDEGSPENCVNYYLDLDGDGFAADGAATGCRCKPEPPFGAVAQGDCNDQDANTAPGKPEVCDNLDNNCDGNTDEGYGDTDGDGTKDCLDMDDDNDGTPDVADCQPTNSQIPSCAGKQCGDDGCGKSCGSCPANGCTVPNSACMAQNRCQSTVGVEKSPSTLWQCTGCGDLDYAGQCWANNIVVWCSNGVLTLVNCTQEFNLNYTCKWSDSAAWYACGY